MVGTQEGLGVIEPFDAFEAAPYSFLFSTASRNADVACFEQLLFVLVLAFVYICIFMVTLTRITLTSVVGSMGRRGRGGDVHDAGIHVIHTRSIVHIVVHVRRPPPPPRVFGQKLPSEICWG